MASLHPSAPIQSQRFQSVTSLSAGKGDNPASPVAEFSRLVEEIAGKFTVSVMDSAQIEPLAHSSIKKTRAPAPQSKNESSAGPDEKPSASETTDGPSTKTASADTQADEETDSDASDDKPASNADADQPSEESSDKDVSESEQDPSSVAISLAAAQTEEPKSEELSETLSGDETEVLAQVLEGEGLELPVGADMVGTSVAAGKAVSTEMPEQPEGVVELDPSLKAVTPEVLVTVETKGQTDARAFSASTDVLPQEEHHLALSPEASAALEQLVQKLNSSPSMLLESPIKALPERDALLASLMLRPLLDQAHRLQETLMGGKVSANNVLVDGSAMKNAERASSDSTPRAAKALPRMNFERAMEKVEAVAKEVARSKDGTSLTFRLDPPQLGNLKVDVSYRDGALHARLTPESAAIAQMLRERTVDLQQVLRKAGIEADSVSVSVGGEHSTSEERERNSSTSGADHDRSSSHQRHQAHGGGTSGGAAHGFMEGRKDLDHWVA